MPPTSMSNISFRQYVTFSDHGQLKGWQPRFQPTQAKSIQKLILDNSSLTFKFGYHNSIFCKDDATTMKLVERAAALRDLKLLVGSGGLDFTRGMDSWTYMSNKSLFGSASHRVHGQLKGWQLFIGLQQKFYKILETATAWPNTLRLCMRQVLFSVAATKGWERCKHNAELVERTAALRNLKLLFGIGCFEFQGNGG